MRRPGAGARGSTVLIIAASEVDADLLYATGLSAPDPFIFLQTGRRSAVVLSDLEIDRGRRQARVNDVLSLSQVQADMRAAGWRAAGLADVAAWLLIKRRVRSVRVPGSFPLRYAESLRRRRLRVVAGEIPFFRERLRKRPEEVRHLAAALRIAECGVEAGVQCLKSSRPGPDGILRLGGERLTSERLRATIDSAVLFAGGIPTQTIVAGGIQACDPHEVGHGPLRANQAIILDVYPRAARTGYFGDITRTVVRGRASEALKRQYHTVAEGQQIALRLLRAGVDGSEVHARILEHFEAAGFPTGSNGRRMQGFFHGTGHGLGLEIHEPPRVGPVAQRLESGNVVTVEPGLYYPARGGVRLEDVVVIGPRGNRNLTRLPKFLEI
ncbi:MAG: Xaa-Pro peptidase family protein [Acidobacteriota bacterium]